MIQQYLLPTMIQHVNAQIHVVMIMIHVHVIIFHQQILMVHIPYVKLTIAPGIKSTNKQTIYIIITISNIHNYYYAPEQY